MSRILISILLSFGLLATPCSDSVVQVLDPQRGVFEYELDDLSSVSTRTLILLYDNLRDGNPEMVPEGEKGIQLLKGNGGESLVKYINKPYRGDLGCFVIGSGAITSTVLVLSSESNALIFAVGAMGGFSTLICFTGRSSLHKEARKKLRVEVRATISHEIAKRLD